MSLAHPKTDAIAWTEQPQFPQHFFLTGVTWAYYEHTLEQIGDRPIRVNFLDGDIEIMSPLPKHDGIKRAITRLIDALSVELNIPTTTLGSATFQHEEKAVGAEPDDCYYFRDIDMVAGMERFDPSVHRAPDLIVEVDLFSTSIPREPIFARLGVPEIWRYQANQLTVRLLQSNGIYADSPTSHAFPLFPMTEFASFIRPTVKGNQTQVIREFQAWIRSLPRM